MAKRIFVTATNTEIGKTYTTLRLMQAFSERGLRVGAIKPIETGVETLPEDGQRLHGLLTQLNPDAREMTLKDVVPVQMALPAAPVVAKGSAPIDWGAIDRALLAMEAVCDICLIEGAGGLLVPVDESTDMIDMIPRFDAKALLVTHCRLGCINDTRLSLEALHHRSIAHEWVLNCQQDDTGFIQTSKPYFDASFPGYYLLQNPEDLERLCTALLL